MYPNGKSDCFLRFPGLFLLFIPIDERRKMGIYTVLMTIILMPVLPYISIFSSIAFCRIFRHLDFENIWLHNGKIT